MQINNQISNQNFGMAILSDANVNKLLKARIKNTATLERLNNIDERQAKNDLVDIRLFVHPDGKKLTATTDARYEKGLLGHYSENILTKLLYGPVGFIEKLAKIADKEAVKIKKSNDVFKKM